MGVMWWCNVRLRGNVDLVIVTGLVIVVWCGVVFFCVVEYGVNYCRVVGGSPEDP